MPLDDPQNSREQYLEKLLMRYGTAILPIVSANLTLPLQTIFQPLVLRRDPFAPQPGPPEQQPSVVRARDGAEALARSDYRRMVVLGGPGMGKTTLLKALLSTAITTAQADSSAPLPIFVSLPDLARTDLSFEIYLQQMTADLEVDPSFATLLTNAVDEGKAFLCLDSLDEVLPAQRPGVIAFLNREAPRLQGTWIIGSRFAEYKGGQFAHSQFAEWELEVLNEQERLALAHQLLPALYKALPNPPPSLPGAKAYLQELERNPDIATWGENPLLFSLAAVLYVQTGQIPTSRAVLYAQVTEAMFAMRIHDATQRAQVRHVLANVALEFYQTHGRNFSLALLRELLPLFVPDQGQQALDALLTRLLDSGVLEPVTYEVYGFKHQMFQEYLAAVALAERLNDAGQRQHAWDLLWRKRRFSRWNEIARLLVGVLTQEYGAEGLQIARAWLSALTKEQSTTEGDPGNLCLLLALKSLDEFGEYTSESEVVYLAQQILTIWEKALIEAQRLGSWQYARPLGLHISALRPFNLQMVIPILQRLQQHDLSIHQFYHIPRGAGTIDRYLTPDILWHVFHDQSISLSTCHTIHAFQTSTAIKRLLAILANADERWSVEERATVAGLLGKLGEQTPLAVLEQTWQDTALYEEIRINAATALRETTAPVPFDTFVLMLSSPDAPLRFIAIEALAEKYSEPERVDLFRQALQDETGRVRECALQALRELGVTLPIQTLQTLFYGKHEKVSRIAGSWLQELGDEVPLELWLDALQYDIEQVRDQSLLMLSHYRDKIPVERLLAMLSRAKRDRYRRTDVRVHCIQALGLLGERVPLKPLLALLHHQDERLRAQALLVLSQRKVTLPVDILLPMLDHSATGSAAAQALAAMGANAPIAALLEHAQPRTSNGAHFAIQALHSLYAYVPTEPVLALLQDEEIKDSYWGTYIELLQLLQLQGMEIPLELLLPALKSPIPQHKHEVAAIVTALSRAGEQAPIEALLRVVYTQIGKRRFPPKGLQQLCYALYEWISPAHLRNALSNTPDDQWLAVSLLGMVPDEENMRLITAVAQDPTRDRTTRSEAMVVLSNLGVNLPLEYLIQATRWCIYEGMGYYLADTVKRLGAQAPLEQLFPLVGEDHNRLQPGVVDALVGIAEHIPLETVLPLLEVKNTLARHAAISILGAMGKRTPLEILDTLLHDPEETLETRCLVLTALGTLGTPAAVDLLIAALEDDNEEIKVHALLALKGDDWQEGKRRLQRFLEQEREFPLELLLKLLADPDDNVINHDIALLGELASLGVAVPVEPLVALLNHEDEFIVSNAAEALCQFGEHTPVDALLTHLYATDDEDIRTSLFNALSSLEAHAPLDTLLAIASDNTKTIGGWRLRSALENLAEAKPELIIQQLHDDPRPFIRRIVLQAIQATKACEWLPLVLETLNDADGQYAAYDRQQNQGYQSTTQAIALTTLGALHACAPVDALLPFLHTNKEMFSDNDERIVVLKALRQFGSRVPQTTLWPLLGSAHREVSRLAFQHLQEVYPAALETLVPMLQAIVRGEPVQDTFATRMYFRIAEMVTFMGHATPPVIEMIVDLLDHPFWEVREEAAQTLGTLRRNIPDRAIQRLLALRQDPESLDVRVSVNQALAEILSLEQAMEDE